MNDDVVRNEVVDAVDFDVVDVLFARRLDRSDLRPRDALSPVALGQRHRASDLLEAPNGDSSVLAREVLVAETGLGFQRPPGNVSSPRALTDRRLEMASGRLDLREHPLAGERQSSLLRADLHVALATDHVLLHE